MTNSKTFSKNLKLSVSDNHHATPLFIGCKVDTELTKVLSFDKQTSLFNILHSDNPCHSSRLWLVGFLKFVGYSQEEICDIIHHGASWGNYDANMTSTQVRSLFKNHSTSNNVRNQISSPSRGSWIKHNEWLKSYQNRPFCTLHYVGCSECPDRNRNCSVMAGVK